MKHKESKISILLVVVLLFGLIVSPVTATTFTPISQPDAAYQASTTKIDISGLTSGSSHSSIADGTLTVSFNSTMTKRGPVPTGWATWSSPPDSETANPHILVSGANDMTMTLSQPVTTFGFELEPNLRQPLPYDVDFILMSGPTVVGNITMTVDGDWGARLFAASVTGGSIDKIVIDGDETAIGFAIAQVRYILVPPVEIDIKPGSDPNSINPKSKGVIPVAILSSPTFDATTVDASSAEFGPDAASPVHNGHLEDVDGDGDLDMVLHFKTASTGLEEGMTEACLTFSDGSESYTACDSVNIVPKGKGPK